MAIDMPSRQMAHTGRAILRIHRRMVATSIPLVNRRVCCVGRNDLERSPSCSRSIAPGLRSLQGDYIRVFASDGSGATHLELDERMMDFYSA